MAQISRIHAFKPHTLTYIHTYIPIRHKDTGRIRVLMRQEKTMKILVNHFLDPRIVLTPNAGILTSTPTTNSITVNYTLYCSCDCM